jgi:hypothetical protein
MQLEAPLQEHRQSFVLGTEVTNSNELVNVPLFGHQVDHQVI